MKAIDLIRRPAAWGARMLAKAAGYSTTTTSGLTPIDPALAAFLGSPSRSGKTVNSDTAMSISAAWSCMRILSETIGALPWGIYESDPSGNSVKVKDHQLGVVLSETPNDDMTSVEYREAEALNLCQAGNAYSLIERLGGDVSSLYPVPSGRIRPRQNTASSRPVGIRVPEGGIFYSMLDREKWEDLPREKVWHVKGFGGNGLVGLSPIGAAREAMGMSLAAEEFGNLFFAQGGKPGGFAVTEKNLSPDQRVVAREALQTMMGGMMNAHKFALFEGGLKPEPWEGPSLEDMLFIAVRQFGVAEVCRFYRIPLHMVAQMQGGASYNTVEMLGQEFVTFTLMPYFTRFEAAVSRWLLRPEERGRYFLRFNYEGLLRADAKGRAELYASGLQNGWMSRNEARAKENLGRVEGLDIFTAQTNLAPVEDLAKIAARATAPAAVTPPAAPKETTVLNVNTTTPAGKPEADFVHPVIQRLERDMTVLEEDIQKSRQQVARLINDSTDRIAEEVSRTVLEGNAVMVKRLTDGQTALEHKATEVKAAAKIRYRLVLAKNGDPIGREPVPEGEEIAPRTI